MRSWEMFDHDENDSAFLRKTSYQAISDDAKETLWIRLNANETVTLELILDWLYFRFIHDLSVLSDAEICLIFEDFWSVGIWNDVLGESLQ